MEKVKIEFTMKFNDDSESTIAQTVPKDVANDICVKIISWKENYIGTFKEIEEFFKQK